MQKWFDNKISDAKVLDFSMELYRKKFKSLIGYQILFSIMSIFIVIAGGLICVPLLTWVDFGSTFGFIIFGFVMFIGLVTFVCMNKAGIFHMAYGYVNGEDVGASEAVGKAFSSFKPILRIVTALAVCLLPIIIIMGIGGVKLTTITMLQKKLASGTIWVIVINALVSSFIMAIIGTYLFYAIHIAIFEESKGFESIKKSIRFAKGEVFKNFFRVLSISMFEWGVNLSVYSAIGVISSFVCFLLGKVQGGESIVSQIIMYGIIVRPILNFVLGILLGPVGPIIWTLYYINMKYKTEGLKIDHMIDRLKQKGDEDNFITLDTNIE
ncbi:hypothetical protein FQB35_10265 [Crassaminicella thermophila]|uniref:Glycerophosphoryl diester phosphodiesterase membrane domain-containing protein n=1 Tax=Crassaminicella thermophila TaxID=2599308 RepID=A0A5C0SFL7_CRATE|nr:glycerophosphoryl diester phosphodiesterase membrane domain-containing protein [Crassaminicella thermophila]QEK12682.1 hypothetical protein FQB35_10265 [Crassaminicella thermophila]